jgi:hypothetical protein
MENKDVGRKETLLACASKKAAYLLPRGFFIEFFTNYLALTSRD